jgi:Ca2+-dependent lipid-binding protein
MDTNVVQELKDTSDTPVHTFTEDATPAQKREQVEELVDGPKVPDFRSLGKKQDGFATEIGTSDADQIKQKIAEAHEKEIQQPVTRQKKAVPVIHTIAGYRVSKALPDDSRIGWTSLSNAKNPGGSLNIHAMEAKKKLVQPIFVFHQSWRDYGIIFIVGIGFHMIAKMGLGVGMIILALFTVGTYFMVNQNRFYTRSRDDILRQLAGINLAASDPEKANWLNSFLQKFWLIFEPVLSAYVVENIDTYLVDYLPGFLDSVRLTTFTLGSKPFTVDSVKTFTDTGLDTIVSLYRYSLGRVLFIYLLHL